MYREELTAKANNDWENEREQNDQETFDSPKWNITECNLEEVSVMYMQRVASILDSIRK